MLKIGIISPEFPPQIGGVETYAYEYSKALAKAGFSVTVFTAPQLSGMVKIPDVRVIPALRRRRRIDKQIIENYPMDAWHVMNAAYGWFTLETDKPVVISIHGNDFLRPYIPLANPDLHRFIGLKAEPTWLKTINQKLNNYLIKKYITWGLPKAKQILTNSRYTESVFLEHFPSCAGKTTAAMVGVADVFFDNLAPPKTQNQCKRFISITRLSEPRKNIGLIIKALANLKNDFDFSYTIVGDGSMKHELEALTAQLDLEDRIQFTGFLTNDEIKHNLTSSDLFILTSSVLPTSHEGFGIVYLEANACGTPVLAANLAGAAEAVAEGISGYTVQEPTEQAITQALQAFLNNSIHFEADQCRAFAHSFSWDKVVSQALPYYQGKIS